MAYFRMLMVFNLVNGLPYAKHVNVLHLMGIEGLLNECEACDMHAMHCFCFWVANMHPAHNC